MKTVLRVFLFCISSVLPAFESGFAFTISGDVHANTTGTDLLQNEKNTTVNTTLSDSILVLGYGGSRATAMYSADLSAAQLKMYVEGSNPSADEYGAGTPTAFSMISFSDTLYFTIPAGTYSQDLFVTLSGHAGAGYSRVNGYTGPNDSNVHQQGVAQISGSLGNDNYSFDYWPHSLTIPSVNFEETFSLTVMILGAGTYSEDVLFNLSVNASLTANGVAVKTWPEGTASSYMVSDFMNGLGFTSITVPEGVTWDSDSGVFLDNPPVLNRFKFGPAIFLLLQ